MNVSVKFNEYEYKKCDTRHLDWDIYVGNMMIGYIIGPKKGKRDYYITRLMFNQRREKIDFSKDKQFQTLDECKIYVHKEFRILIKKLHRYYVLMKKPWLETTYNQVTKK